MTQETFQLVKERCLLANLNVRTENHGDEKEPAIDLSFQFDSANNLLLKLHPELRSTFYVGADTRDLVDVDHMPHLRFPLLGPIAWDLELPSVVLRVHDDGGAVDIVLGGGKANKFKLTMVEGGTVKWQFRCQFSQPDPDDVSYLMGALSRVVAISLESADEEEQPDNFEQAELLSQEPHSAARQEAESLFSAPPTDMTLTPDDVVNAPEWGGEASTVQ